MADNVHTAWMDQSTRDRDEVYQVRREHMAAKAAGPVEDPVRIDYLPSENDTWRIAKTALDRRWNSVACQEILDARDRLDLPNHRVPHLDEVTRRLQPRSGFQFRAVPGLVPVIDFFGSLAAGIFLSTQYVRHQASPLYTPEPDIIHEVLGHGTCLAEPHLAMLHRQAGSAMLRVETERARRFIADVFWFSAEFGVLRNEHGLTAYGAGLLSSVGELDHFVANAKIEPINPARMGTASYDISNYQPLLFSARSLNEVLDTVGEFFVRVDDDEVVSVLASTVESV